MSENAAVNLILYSPESEAGRHQLAECVSEIHAGAILQRLKELNCPTGQKLALLDAVMETIRKNSLKQED